MFSSVPQTPFPSDDLLARCLHRDGSSTPTPAEFWKNYHKKLELLQHEACFSVAFKACSLPADMPSSLKRNSAGFPISPVWAGQEALLRCLQGGTAPSSPPPATKPFQAGHVCCQLKRCLPLVREPSAGGSCTLPWPAASKSSSATVCGTIAQDFSRVTSTSGDITSLHIPAHAAMRSNAAEGQLFRLLYQGARLSEPNFPHFRVFGIKLYILVRNSLEITTS